MPNRYIFSLSDVFLELLRLSGATKEAIQAELKVLGVRAPKKDFDAMWDRLVERLGYEDAADRVFDIVATFADERLIVALVDVHLAGSTRRRSNDRKIMDVLFFDNGKPRRIAKLFVRYLEDGGWFDSLAEPAASARPPAVESQATWSITVSEILAESQRRHAVEDEVLGFIYVKGRDVIRGCDFRSFLTNEERTHAFDRLVSDGLIRLLDRESAVLTPEGIKRIVPQASPVHAGPTTTFNIQGSVQNLAQVLGDGARIRQSGGAANEARDLLNQARDAVTRTVPEEHRVEAEQIIEVLDAELDRPSMKPLVLRSLAKNQIFTGTVSNLLSKAIELIVSTVSS